MRARGRVAVAVAGAGLCWLYFRQASTIWVTSDGASNALQAWDMLHGNLLLHGWWLSDVTFCTTELPEYMLVELARGLSVSVVWVSAALTYTLLVLLAGFLAAGPATRERTAGEAATGDTVRVPGRERLVRALLAIGLVLAPSSVLGTPMLLSSPDHTGTAVPLLAVLLFLDRARFRSVRSPAGRRWAAPGAVAMLAGLALAWIQVADQVGLYAGALPVAAVCGLRFAWYAWTWLRGTAIGPPRRARAAPAARASTAEATLAGVSAGEMSTAGVRTAGTGPAGARSPGTGTREAPVTPAGKAGTGEARASAARTGLAGAGAAGPGEPAGRPASASLAGAGAGRRQGAGEPGPARARAAFRASAARVDLLLALAALASVPVALVALRAIRQLGGFYAAPVTAGGDSMLAPLSQLPLHARMTAESVEVLFGANYFDQKQPVLLVIACAHFLGVALALAGLVVAIWLLLAGRLDRVSQVLVAAILVLLAGGLLGTRMLDILAAHEIAAVAPFGAALAGRTLGGPLARLRVGAAWRRRPASGQDSGAPGRGARDPGGRGQRAPRLGIAALGLGLAAALGFLCYDGTLASYGAGGQPVADWLAARH
ncbi:MAG TPA: hypothetical protein VH478_25010, partial [Trebonia sp.]|nr:hypothetical protein [Trebonia sp.]